MSIIPRHVQRRFEQRWASRFILPVATDVPKSHAINRSPRAAKTKEKPAKVKQ